MRAGAAWAHTRCGIPQGRGARGFPLESNVPQGGVLPPGQGPLRRDPPGPRSPRPPEQDPTGQETPDAHRVSPSQDR